MGSIDNRYYLTLRIGAIFSHAFSLFRFVRSKQEQQR